MEPWSERSADPYEFVVQPRRSFPACRALHEIEERAPSARTLLDVAYGTGWYLERLREWFEVEGPDSSPGICVTTALYRWARRTMLTVRVLASQDRAALRTKLGGPP